MKALIVIDMQEEYGPSGALTVDRLDGTVTNVKRLLGVARKSSGAIVVNVRHVSRKPGDSSFDAGSSTLAFLAGCEPLEGELVITKQYPGSFTNPALDRYLRKSSVDKVIICGLTSFLCCDTTAREAYQLGYEVEYVEDAISEFGLGDLSSSELHAAINAIQGVMFSSVVSTDQAAESLQ